MNKIMQINLGGYALTIDEDAYQFLSNYLDDIRRRLSEHEGRDEILRDIEARLGELISSRLGGRAIVSLADVEAAAEVMGKPEDFGGEAGGSSASTGKSGEAKAFKPGRRLYRDESDAVIGGVCSGLAAYFGLNDPLWLRLIFILLALISFGFWVPAYVLLWLLIPPARTAAERLAMRGQTPNLENIVREVEEGAERFARRAGAFGQQAGSKLGATSSNLASGCAAFLVQFFKGTAIFIAIGLVLALGATWVAGTIAFFTGQSYISFLNPLPTEAAYLGFINLFFVVGIPVIGLALWLLRTIFRFQSPAWLGAGMTVLWVLNIISLFALAFWGAKQYSEEGSLSRTVDFSGMTSDTLYVRFDPQDISSWRWDNDSDIYFDVNRRSVGTPRIEVELSQSGRFEGVSTLHARGPSAEAAHKYASEIPFDVTLAGNTLTLPARIRLGNEGWRVQRAKLLLRVPEGKYIVFEEGPHRRVEADYADNTYRVKNNPGQAFQMTLSGLMCPHCAFGDDGLGSNDPVENFIFNGDLKVDLLHDETFGIHCPDNTSGAEEVSVVRRGRTLILSAAKGKGSGAIRCTVHTPVFTSLVANGKGEVTIQGFDESRSSITATGPINIRGLYNSNNLRVTLNNRASVELMGEGDKLEAYLANGAKIEASGWRVEVANINAANESTARVNADEEVNVRSDASSTVHTTGSAAVRRL
ncbi:MAG: PspC domain-containing protein [Saprospiraceae bacterium]|nr:PspC domain-containing protein [Saprospiraceae bacterium]MDW8229107.1 PspC domain-containing protein [Saprospiraceae bacterium]